ncbi:hypothetical protein [Draconibacterium halophilum]|uniref:Uncharacterized protein n=1 Tax=Draconibacterium halophilum TaxID=2706887 RepID=A0A6C0RF80_9BACT|nr:hypothetical protein [Draconibacterium halophilum]QIA08727.1 hypothetical protein G0Q07_13800 [Draconibacterium halophilum]
MAEADKNWAAEMTALTTNNTLVNNLPKNENELIDKVHEPGCGDLFPYLSEKDYKLIAGDREIPNHQHWGQRIANG